MAEPERIGEILKRVFADLEKTYGKTIPRNLASGPAALKPPAREKKENDERIGASASD